MAIPNKNVLGNPNVTEGDFQTALESLRESVIGSGKAYDSANTYAQYDTCVSGGITYYSKVNGNIGNSPAINTYWGLEPDLLNAVAKVTTTDNCIMRANGTAGDIQPSTATIDDVGNLTLTVATNNGLKVTNSTVTGIFNASGNPSLVVGTLTNHTIDLYTNNILRARVGVDGSFLMLGGGFGYAVGGTVIQANAKNVAVTLNKYSGEITMNNASLAAGASVSFIVNNSLITSIDEVTVTGVWGTVDPRNYDIKCNMVGSGLFSIKVTNITASALAEAVSIMFFSRKGAIA